MRALRWVALVTVFGVVACGAKKEIEPVVTFPNAIDCRTVKLFDQNMEPPSSEIPAEWRVFAGHWGNGAWDGKLCHEIVVEAIYPNGTARVVELQGDYAPWNRWPTAFRRTGVFTEDGALVLPIGADDSMTYRHDGGVIYGVWEQGPGYQVGVTLTPK